MSVEQLITDNIDIWTSAIKTKSASGRGSSNKLELYGIKKLRELILELAVRGKLVPQDPTDEPASELLNRSKNVKAELIDSGVLKKSRSKKNIQPERFFEYPPEWMEASLEDLIHVINGRAYKKNEMLEEGTPILRVGNLFTSNDWYYSDLELEPEKYIDDGDLIYAWSASFGPFIWQGGRVIYHYHIWKMDIFSEECLDKHFSKIFLQAISERIKASGSGIAMIHMTKERMEKIVHPLPPIEEQKRIVAKVDELMALCDQLESKTKSSIEAHQLLVKTLLETLTNAKDADDLNDSWQRISEHSDVLFATEDSIDQLKQTILQLAVMGKLVKQDPNDEPASKLLERIAAEKEQLIKDKKIKKQKPLPPIADDEKPFDLPDGWEWCRLADIACFENGDRSSKYPSGSDLVGKGVPFFGAPDIEDGFLAFGSDLRFITKEKFESLNSGKLRHEDIVVLLRGSVGKTAMFLKSDEYNTGFINAQMLIIRAINSNIVSFKKVFFDSAAYWKQVADEKSGAVIQQMPASAIAKMLFPLPPLPEQERIVTKVEELIALCDALKSKLKMVQKVQLDISEAFVKQAS